MQNWGADFGNYAGKSLLKFIKIEILKLVIMHVMLVELFH